MNTNEVVYGVNARQRWKQVRTIQIIIVFESRIQIKLFMAVNDKQRWEHKLEPFKNHCI